MSKRRAVMAPLLIEDLTFWIKNDRKVAGRKVALRITRLMDAILRDPFEGEGKPEPLKRLGPNHWSRRITEEHRLVYEVSGEEIHFLQARYHY